MRLRALYGTNRVPFFAGFVVNRAGATRTRSEDEGVRIEDGVVAGTFEWFGGPVAAVRTGTLKRSPVAVAAAGEKNAGGSVRTFTSNDITIDAIPRRPRPVALTDEVT